MVFVRSAEVLNLLKKTTLIYGSFRIR